MQRTYRHFSKEEIQMAGQWVEEKALNITDYLENANKNYNETLHRTC